MIVSPLFIFALISTTFALTGFDQTNPQNKQLIEQIKKSGKSESEIRDLLKRSGMSDSEIERQIENQKQNGQLPATPVDNQSQLKSENLPHKGNLTTDNENVEFNELSLFDEFEKTDEQVVSIALSDPTLSL